MNIRSVALSLVAVVAIAGVSLAGPGKSETGAATPHPYFKDDGTLSWSKTLAEAQSAAKSSDKLIFIEYGREACGNCKALCQTVLPDAKVKARLGALCVGLAADCDKPESDVQKLMRDNLAGAQTLPFVGIVTTDMKWVGGFSGFKSVEEFDAILTAAETSPLLQASPEVTKKLDGIAAQAGKAAEKGDWKGVFAASKAAGDLKGRSPLRDKIAEIVAKGRTWADAEMAKALETVTSGGDRAAVRAALSKVSSAFSGEPEQKDAEAGVKAIAKLTTIEALPAEQQDAARERATKDFAATRWVALFAKK